MEKDVELLKAKAMYLTAIGILLLGIAALLWAGNQIISTIHLRRYMMDATWGPYRQKISGARNPHVPREFSTRGIRPNATSVPAPIKLYSTDSDSTK